MADPAPLPTERPFQVWTVDGVIHSGHPNEDAAKQARARADAQAAELGLAARYEVRTKDGDDG